MRRRGQTQIFRSTDGNINGGCRIRTKVEKAFRRDQWSLPHPHQSRKGVSSCRSGPRRQAPYPEDVLERKVVEGVRDDISIVHRQRSHERDLSNQKAKHTKRE